MDPETSGETIDAVEAAPESQEVDELQCEMCDDSDVRFDSKKIAELEKTSIDG